MNSGDSVADNLARAGKLLQAAADGGALLAALPEYFAVLSSDETLKLKAAEKDGAGPIQEFLAEQAARHKIHIVGGAIPIVADKSRVFSSCLLFAPSGERIARYDKMHLFRFDGKIDETQTIARGNEVVSVPTSLGNIGLAICYDLRFPELFRKMNSPDIIVAPAAFTPETGAAHWRVLLRARAVENLAHIIAPAQAGVHPGGRKTFGDSVVVDGWGQVIGEAKTAEDEVIFATINSEERQQQRKRLPALSHRLL